MKELTKARIVGLAGGATAVGAAVFALQHRKAPRRAVSTRQARKIGEELEIDYSRFSLEELRRGMEVEFEHGRRNPATDVTGDDLQVTGKIALAHLNEYPDYYVRLARMEEEAKAFWREVEAPLGSPTNPMPS